MYVTRARDFGASISLLSNIAGCFFVYFQNFELKISSTFPIDPLLLCFHFQNYFRKQISLSNLLISFMSICNVFSKYFDLFWRFLFVLLGHTLKKFSSTFIFLKNRPVVVHGITVIGYIHYKQLFMPRPTCVIVYFNFNSAIHASRLNGDDAGPL